MFVIIDKKAKSIHIKIILSRYQQVDTCLKPEDQQQQWRLLTAGRWRERGCHVDDTCMEIRVSPQASCPQTLENVYI